MTEEVETIIHPLTRTPVKGRMLKAGEKIKEGDLVRFPKKGWKPTMILGDIEKPEGIIYFRPDPEPAKTHSIERT